MIESLTFFFSSFRVPMLWMIDVYCWQAGGDPDGDDVAYCACPAFGVLFLLLLRFWWVADAGGWVVGDADRDARYEAGAVYTNGIAVSLEGDGRGRC